MAEDGGQAVKETVNNMQKIVEKISIIQEIAGQTRLLSLNASIEAARAGDSGRGFAVVASEVSKLAELSSRAASEIKELTQSSVTIAYDAGKKLEAVVPEIVKTADSVSKITSSGYEQELAIEELNLSMHEVNRFVQMNADLSEKLATTATSSAKYAKQLKDVISQFKV